MNKTRIFSAVSLMVLFLFVFLALGSGGTTEPEKVEKPEPVDKEVAAPSPEAEPAHETYFMGDTVKMGDLIFTLNSARWDKGSEFMKPDPGEKWLVFDCTIENASASATTISSFLMFVLYDEENYSSDLTLFADTKGSLDGELGPGRKMRGEIAFDVEEAHSQWEFIFQPNVFGFGQAIFLINANEVN